MPTIERQRELDRPVVVEVGEADADQRDALIPDHRHCRREQRSLGREQRRGIGRRLGQRVRPRRSRPEESIALYRHALSLAIDHDLPEAALRAYNNLSEEMSDRDRYEEALELYERGLALASRVGDGTWQRALLSEIVFPLMMTGRWDEALERAAQVPDSQKGGTDIIGLLVSIPVITVARGDFDRAEQILEIFEGYGRSNDVQEAAAYACASASVLRARSRDEEALEAARRAVTGGLQVGYSTAAKIGFTQGIGAAFSLGDLDAVRGFIRTIDEMQPGIVTPFLRALADRSRARIAVLEDDGRHGGAELQGRDRSVPRDGDPVLARALPGRVRRVARRPGPSRGGSADVAGGSRHPRPVGSKHLAGAARPLRGGPGGDGLRSSSSRLRLVTYSSRSASKVPREAFSGPSSLYMRPRLSVMPGSPPVKPAIVRSVRSRQRSASARTSGSDGSVPASRWAFICAESSAHSRSMAAIWSSPTSSRRASSCASCSGV